MAKNKKILVTDNSLADVSSGERVRMQYLEDAINRIGQCFGPDSCDQVYRIEAQDAATRYEIYAAGGQLVIKNTTTGATANIIALP